MVCDVGSDRCRAYRAGWESRQADFIVGVGASSRQLQTRRMADVFISYASEDRARAHALATQLEARGWSVWWDRKIVAGDAFDETIERELDGARCVVVLWSANSITSEWVKNEAAAAAEHGTLVPAQIDAVKLPLEFRRKQTANLSGWDGSANHPGLQTLCEGVAAKLEAGSVAAQRPIVEAPPRDASPTRRWVWPVALASVAVLALGGWWGSQRASSVDHGRRSDPPLSSYPLSCLGGGPFDVVKDAHAGVRIGFAPAARSAASPLQPGECSWSDRPLNANEPHVICDSTKGASKLVHSLAQRNEQIQVYVHFESEGKCFRVVDF